MNQIEQWKKVAGFETYSVSDQGNVRNDKTKRILKLTPNSHGYIGTGLTNNKPSKMIKVHRLVASAFLPNPENNKSVDHIRNHID